MERVLFELKYIRDYNYGDLKKIGWGRGSRTDKKVHALQNCFTCKLHINKGDDWEDHRKKINEALPKDQKIFALFPVGGRFNAKNCTSHREYSYFLPSFMLQPLNEESFLGKQKKEDILTEAEKSLAQDGQSLVTEVAKGVKRIIT